MTEPIRVVLASDDNYARPLAVAARSLVLNLRTNAELELFVIDMGLTEASRTAISTSLADPRVTLTYCRGTGRVDDLPTGPTFIKWTSAVYGTLLIPELLPASIDRVLYLDCDLVVRRDVADLCTASLDGAIGMGVPDVCAPYVSAPWGLAHWFEAGRRADEFNFNTGVLVIDLDAWRREEVARKAIEYVRSDRFWKVVDQEAINAVIGGQMRCLDGRWNQQPEVYSGDYAPFLPYTDDVIEQIKSDPWIIHYSSPGKPWEYGTAHPWRDEWYRYLDQTAYRGWRPEPPPLSRRLVGAAATRARTAAKRLKLD